MKFIFSVLIVLLALLQYEFWFSDGGIRTVWQLQKNIAAQQKINDQLAQQNDALAVQIQHLKHSDAAIESRARNELGMIKSNEIFYQIVK